MPQHVNREGLKMARLLMVLSGMSPLFVLWAIRGNRLVPDRYFLSICAALVILPNAFLALRIRTAMKLKECREMVVGHAEDHRDHLLVYLFSMLLPFYTTDFVRWRDVAAVCAALSFIVFLFWHLNLHYMNVLFAAFGYRVFTLSPVADANVLSGKTTQVLITRRTELSNGERLVAYRLSDTVYFEADA
jgi:hypothetical protein